MSQEKGRGYGEKLAALEAPVRPQKIEGMDQKVVDRQEKGVGGHRVALDVGVPGRAEAVAVAELSRPVSPQEFLSNNGFLNILHNGKVNESSMVTREDLVYAPARMLEAIRDWRETPEKPIFEHATLVEVRQMLEALVNGQPVPLSIRIPNEGGLSMAIERIVKLMAAEAKDVVEMEASLNAMAKKQEIKDRAEAALDQEKARTEIADGQKLLNDALSRLNHKTFKGVEGQQEISSLMEAVRHNIYRLNSARKVNQMGINQPGGGPIQEPEVIYRLSFWFQPEKKGFFSKLPRKQITEVQISRESNGFLKAFEKSRIE